MTKIAGKKRQAATKAAVKPNASLDAVTQEAARTYAQSDGRVIQRNLSVLQFELQTQEDHLQGLMASIVEVKARKARTEAKILGLTSVLARR